MKNLFEEIMNKYKVRFYPKQKNRFREFIIKEFESIGYDNIIVDNGKNVIVGDIETAKTIFTAHYDTPMFSAYITPFTSIFGHLVGSIVSSIFLVLITFITLPLMMLLIFPKLDLSIVLLIGPLIFFASYLIPNPANANDNTSGVLSVLHMAKLSKYNNNLESFAFVLFNGEEFGLRGSKKLAQNIKKKSGELPNFLVINFDCVGLGAKLLLAYKSPTSKDFVEVTANLCKHQNKEIKILKASMFLGSDNLSFNNGVMVAMVKKSMLGSFYLPGIHMPSDKKISLKNIEFCVQIVLEALMKNIEEK